jgi:hypothetical protein
MDMEVLSIAEATSGVALSCWLMAKRASAKIGRIRADADHEISHWKTEAARARIKAYELKLEMDAWKAGHAQGRRDVISALPLLAVKHDPVNHDLATCDCQSATQIEHNA